MPICKTRLKIASLKLHPDILGFDELIQENGFHDINGLVQDCSISIANTGDTAVLH